MSFITNNEKWTRIFQINLQKKPRIVKTELDLFNNLFGIVSVFFVFVFHFHSSFRNKNNEKTEITKFSIVRKQLLKIWEHRFGNFKFQLSQNLYRFIVFTTSLSVIDQLSFVMYCRFHIRLDQAWLLPAVHHALLPRGTKVTLQIHQWFQYLEQVTQPPPRPRSHQAALRHSEMPDCQVHGISLSLSLSPWSQKLSCLPFTS